MWGSSPQPEPGGGSVSGRRRRQVGTSCQYHLSETILHIVFFIFFILPLIAIKAFAVTKLLPWVRLWRGPSDTTWIITVWSTPDMKPIALVCWNTFRVQFLCFDTRHATTDWVGSLGPLSSTLGPGRATTLISNWRHLSRRDYPLRIAHLATLNQ